MTPLAIKMLAFRSKLLGDMRALTPDTAQEELFRVTGTWKRLRTETTKAATLPGEAVAYFAELWTTPEWENFDRIRSNSFKRKMRAEAGPKAKAAEALRKRCKYHGVSDPKDLPPKSPRGRKSTMKNAE